MSPLEMIPSLNCLFYADDVVLVAERSKMIDLLQKCEYYSMQMGYKWKPSKCVILDSYTDPIPYIVYGQPLPQKTIFAYLGVLFKQGGYLDPEELIQHNTRKALATMNLLSSIGVNPSGFSKLLSTRFYTHIVRPQLEYGAAIHRFTSSQLHTLEETQDICIGRIYGAHSKVSTKVMLHLSKLPLMSERVNILQAQFLFGSLLLPDGSLLSFLLPCIQSTRSQQRYLLSRAPLWKMTAASNDDLDTCAFKAIKRQFLQQNLDMRLTNRNSKLLSHCRRLVSLDPILWLPMSTLERSRCLRWRSDWLPGSKPKPCPRHPAHHLSKKHAISRLNMHRHLCMPEKIPDPLSFLLNRLPSRPSVPSDLALSWLQRWPVICSILHEHDQLHHATAIPTTRSHGQKLLKWIKQFL